MRRGFQFDDGGRAAAGYRGRAGDCVVRAIAIAAERPYQEIYDLVNRAALRERTGKRKRGISNARTGVYKVSIHRVMDALGWEWTPTMQIGSGCRVHLRSDELPAGRLVVSVSKHLTAVIDGVIHDTHDCSRRGRRCVYGYWSEGQGTRSRKRFEPDNARHALRRATLQEVESTSEEVIRRRPRRPEELKPRKKGFWEWLFG